MNPGISQRISVKDLVKIFEEGSNKSKRNGNLSLKKLEKSNRNSSGVRPTTSQKPNNIQTAPHFTNAPTRFDLSEAKQEYRFDTLQQKELVKSIRDLGYDVEENHESTQSTLAQLFKDICINKGIQCFVQGQLPKSDSSGFNSKGVGFNFSVGPKVGDKPVFDGGMGLAQLKAENPDAVKVSTDQGEILFNPNKLVDENSIARDIKCNLNLLTYLQKLVHPEDYERLRGEAFPEGKKKPLTSGMHAYRFFASNYPEGSPKLIATLDKYESPENYFQKINNAIKVATKDWKNPVQDYKGFLEQIYHPKSPVYANENWSPNNPKYGTQTPLELIETLKNMEQKPSFNAKDKNEMFALTILQAQVESHLVHDIMTNKDQTSITDEFQFFANALTDQDLRDVLPDGVLTLDEIPSKVAMFDTVPAFNMFNNAIQSDLKLDRVAWVRMCVENGLDNFISATESLEKFEAMWKDIFADNNAIDEKVMLSQWQAFNDLQLDNVTIIQDAPHDHDDQIVVAMAVALKLRGKIGVLSVVEGARNTDVVKKENLKTTFPRVYIDLFPNAMDELKNRNDVNFLINYPRDGLPHYNNNGQEMPGPKKPSHESMNALSDDKVEPFNVQQFTLGHLAKNGKLLIIAPISFAAAVYASANNA